MWGTPLTSRTHQEKLLVNLVLRLSEYFIKLLRQSFLEFRVDVGKSFPSSSRYSATIHRNDFSSADGTSPNETSAPSFAIVFLLLATNFVVNSDT